VLPTENRGKVEHEAIPKVSSDAATSNLTPPSRESAKGNELNASIKTLWDWLKIKSKKWSWKPTSAQKLAQAEARLLKETGLQFEQMMVKTEAHTINTIKLGNGHLLYYYMVLEQDLVSGQVTSKSSLNIILSML